MLNIVFSDDLNGHHRRRLNGLCYLNSTSVRPMMMMSSNCATRCYKTMMTTTNDCCSTSDPGSLSYLTESLIPSMNLCYPTSNY